MQAKFIRQYKIGFFPRVLLGLVYCILVQSQFGCTFASSNCSTQTSCATEGSSNSSNFPPGSDITLTNITPRLSVPSKDWSTVNLSGSFSDWGAGTLTKVKAFEVDSSGSVTVPLGEASIGANGSFQVTLNRMPAGNSVVLLNGDGHPFLAFAAGSSEPISITPLSSFAASYAQSNRSRFSSWDETLSMADLKVAYTFGLRDRPTKSMALPRTLSAAERKAVGTMIRTAMLTTGLSDQLNLGVLDTNLISDSDIQSIVGLSIIKCAQLYASGITSNLQSALNSDFADGTIDGTFLSQPIELGGGSLYRTILSDWIACINVVLK